MNNQDLAQYYQDHSDLAFELRVMRMVNNEGICLDHGGKYIDKVTGKIREYDLLARPKTNILNGLTEKVGFIDVLLCIECKNVDQQFPIIVGCREFHFDTVDCFGVNKRFGMTPDVYKYPIEISKMFRFVSAFGNYFLNYIGVEIIQVAKKDKAPDRSSTYDKWSQAVSHAFYRYDEMFNKIVSVNDGIQGNVWCVPILVVPNGQLKIAIEEKGKGIFVDDINGSVFKVGAEFHPKSLPDNNIGSLGISNYFVFTEDGLRNFLQMF